MSEIIYNNTCLVCGAVMPLTEAVTHLNQNVGHVLVETMVRSDDPVTKIAVNTRKEDVKSEWDTQCQEVNATLTLSGEEAISTDSTKKGWRSQTFRVKFDEKFPTIPSVTFIDIVYRDTIDLTLENVTKKFFEITFSIKNPSSGELPSVRFTWEATNASN